MDSNLKIPEVELILNCSRARVDMLTQNRIELILDKNLNWEYIIHMAHIHHVSPLLYWNLRNYPSQIPEETFSYLREHFRNNTQKNLFFTGELLKIIKTFNKKDLMVIPYKGPVLAINAYDNLALREFGDIDLYISKNDVLVVRDLLALMSYVPEYKIEKNKEEKFINGQRDLSFFNKSNNTTLEVHWTFKGHLFCLPNKSDIWDGNNYIETTLNEMKVKTLSDEEMLLVLALHNASHRWQRLSWICDFKEMIESNKNLNYFNLIKKAEEKKILRILIINFVLARDLLNFEITEEIKIFLDNDDVVMEITEKVKSRLFLREQRSSSLFEEIFFRLKLREDVLYGIKDVIKGLITPTIYELKTLPLPTYLWFVYYIYRPLNLLFRYNLK